MSDPKAPPAPPAKAATLVYEVRYSFRSGDLAYPRGMKIVVSDGSAEHRGVALFKHVRKLSNQEAAAYLAGQKAKAADEKAAAKAAAK